MQPVCPRARAEWLLLAAAVATGDGSFGQLTLTLADELQSGEHALTAVGQTSGRRSTGTLWIRAPQPWLVLDTYDVPQYGDLGLVADPHIQYAVGLAVTDLDAAMAELQSRGIETVCPIWKTRSVWGRPAVCSSLRGHAPRDGWPAGASTFREHGRPT